VKKWAKTLPNTFFAKIITYISPWKKVAHKFELLPKVNNRPIGEKSPNLVALVVEAIVITKTVSEIWIRSHDRDLQRHE
jgi:hypothetical protein